MTATGATVRGVVYPGSCPAQVWFEYGTDTSYGNSTPPVVVGSANEWIDVAATITQLDPETTYHFRILSSNENGQIQDKDQTFATDTYFYSPVTQSPTSLAGADLVFADFTGDDNADLLVGGGGTGPETTLGYAAEALWSFSYATSFSDNPGLYWPSFAAGDFNNDGKVDFFACGSKTTIPRSLLRRNTIMDGQGWTFATESGIASSFFSAPAWGDYDNDGDLDFAFSINDRYGDIYLHIYRNTGGRLSLVMNLPTPGGARSLQWGDYDNDGDLDLLITGQYWKAPAADIYRNDQGVFTDVFAPVRKVRAGDAKWCDYDNDGDLDIAVSGFNDHAEYGRVAEAHIHRNDGNGGFHEAMLLTGQWDGRLAWGDFDNDGDSDLLICGSTDGTDSGAATRLWRNDLGNTAVSFVEISGYLPGITVGAVAWGDFNNDGTLDIGLSGRTTSSKALTKVFENLVYPNTRPSVPENPAVSVECNRVVFSWSASTDAETPPAALTYNMRVGTAPGGSEIMSPHANPETGARRLWEMGNVQLGTDAWLRLPAGTYYWAVQAVDNGYLGSPFSEEQSFTLPSITTVDITEVLRPASDQFLVRFVSCPGNNYIAQKSTDLSDPDGWFDLGQAAETAPGEFEFLDPEATGEQGFYRLRLP